MGRQQIATGIVGICIGFILGFFVAKIGGNSPGQLASGAPNPQSQNELPEDHPSPELLARVQHLQERAQADAEDRQARVELGNAFYDMGRFDAAIPWYQEALELQPDDVSVNTDLGTSYLYVGKVDTAIETYQNSLRIQENHPQTLQNLGITHFASDRYDEAINYWQKLIENHPEYPHVEEIKKQIEAAEQKLGQP